MCLIGAGLMEKSQLCAFAGGETEISVKVRVNSRGMTVGQKVEGTHSTARAAGLIALARGSALGTIGAVHVGLFVFES